MGATQSTEWESQPPSPAPTPATAPAPAPTMPALLLDASSAPDSKPKPPEPQRFRMPTEVNNIINAYAVQYNSQNPDDKMLEWLNKRRHLQLEWTIHELCRIIGDRHFQQWALHQNATQQMERWMPVLENALKDWLFKYSDKTEHWNPELQKELVKIEARDKINYYDDKPSWRLGDLFYVFNKLCLNKKYSEIPGDKAGSKLYPTVVRKSAPTPQNRAARLYLRAYGNPSLVSPR